MYKNEGTYLYNVPMDIMRVLIYNNIKIRNQKTNAEGNTMTYLKNITTLEELRKEYKRLVKIIIQITAELPTILKLSMWNMKSSSKSWKNPIHIIGRNTINKRMK